MGSAIAVAEAFRRLHSGIVVPDYEALLTQTYSTGAIIPAGASVIDIGAHRGRHTENFARLAGPTGRVEAIEPIPHLGDHLAAAFADTPWVTVHRFALSHTAGSFPFKLVPEALEMSGLREREYGREGLEVRTIDMEVRTLDQQFGKLARVDYIKIDVEGAEIDCLTGGAGILASRRPIVSVEYGRPSYSRYGLEARSLFDFAKVHGYVLSDFFANMILSVDEWTMVCDRSYWDFFLIPEERVDWWTSAFAVRPLQG